ncbi:MAG TPA: hypothetical protein VHA75_18935, partial [Rugosimonospora sp.]|nr:hypothetical protein [Rugosimonospora sp.]
AEASLRATDNGRWLVNELRTARAGWESKIRARRDAGVWRLLEVLVRQPVVDAPTVATELGIAPSNAGRAVAPLVEAGVLTEFTGSARNRMWQANEVLAALDEFAARAGRRVP